MTKRATRAPDKQYFKRHLVQIQNNITELFLIIHSTTFAQMAPLRWTKGLPELHIRNIFKRHLYLNHWSKFKIISQNFSSWCLLLNLHKWFCSTKHGAARALDKKCLLMKFPTEPLIQIQNNFTELFLMSPFTKIAQIVPLHWTKWPPKLQIRNIFKRHLLLNDWSKFKVIHRFFPHDAFYQNCTNGSAPSSKRGVRALDKQYL